MRYLGTITAGLVACAAIACGGDGGPAAPSPLVFSTHASPHFMFRHTALDAATVSTLAAAVESQYPRIVADLRVSDMPTTNVTLYPDRNSFLDAVAPVVGGVPLFASGAVTGVDQIHVISPNAALGNTSDRITAIVHEFAHCVTLRVNPRFGNNPRWLWETVALYEAQQFVHPRTLPYMVRREPPTIPRLNQIDASTIYEVGYLIGEFIVTQWGYDGLLWLIQATGDVNRTLGITDDEFMSRWFTAVASRYGI